MSSQLNQDQTTLASKMPSLTKLRTGLNTSEGPRAKTAGEMGMNLFRQQTSQGRRTANTGSRERRLQSKSHVFEVLPKEITFNDIEVNQVYEAQVIVRNLTQVSRRLRIQQPQTSRFRVDYDQQGSLAAGLAMKLILIFETQQIDDFHDSIVIRSEEGYMLEIPLHALKSQPQLEFDPILELGYTKVGVEKSQNITFKNSGKQPGKINFKVDSKNVKIDPILLNLNPGAIQDVKITFIGNQPQIFRSEIQVIQNWTTVIRQIDVSCTVVEYSIFFLDDTQSQTSMIEFGDMLLGNQKSLSGLLVNNTPLPQKWSAMVRKGFHSSMQTEGQLLTPHEVGSEWLEKIVQCYPERGILDPYAQTLIRVECRAVPTEEDIQKCSNYALRDNNGSKGSQHERSSEIKYSLFFNFENKQTILQEEVLILHVSALQVMPQLRVNKQLLNFGACPVHEVRDCLITLENTHREQQIDVIFSRVPQFRVQPEKILIGPGVKTTITVSFQPKNVGKVSTNLEILIVDNNFRIPIQIVASSTYNSDRRPVTRGPEALPEHFKHEAQFIDDDHIEYFQTKRKQIQSENILNRTQAKHLKNTPLAQEMLDLFFQDESSNIPETFEKRKQQLTDWEQDQFSDKITQYYKSKENQQKYTQYLREERASRLQKKRDQIVQMRVEEMEKKVKQAELEEKKKIREKQEVSGKPPPPPPPPLDSDEEDKRAANDPKKFAPHDYEFELGMMETGVIENELQLPPNTDGLYVTKPIDKYEPLKSANEKGIFSPDPMQPMRKRFPNQPQTHKELRDVNSDLNGEELKKIQAGPVKIDFGKVFVKSKIWRTFHIKNDLRNAISAQILIDKEELQGTYQQPQIIPTSETARFEILLQSNQLGVFKSTVKYRINGKYTFEFLVTAQIEAVSLKLSSNQFKFEFPDDSLNMEVSEQIKLVNQGNAVAKFKWIIPESKVFTVSNTEGEVQAGKTLELQIIYRPSNFQIKDDRLQNNKNFSLLNQIRMDSEKLILKIIDGLDQVVDVTGSVNDAKCVLKQQSLDLKDLLVCKLESRFFTIRNQSRVSAVYKILFDKLPAACDISPHQGKIAQDESKDITVKYQTREESDVKTDIIILIRGGRVLKIPFQVRTLIPQVEITQDQFNFGKLTTLGNEGQLPMTLINNSPIMAELILDMRPQNENPEAPDGIECLQVLEIENNDESVLRSIHEEEDSENKTVKARNPEEDDSDQHDSEVGSSEDELERKEPKRFLIQLQGNSKLEFLLKFAPKDVKTYNFDLPLTLNRYGRLGGLTRSVVCRGLKPKFLLDPQTLEFPRKIITSIDKCFPIHQEIILSNPERKSIGWRFDLTQIVGDKTFSITPTEGTIEAGQNFKVKAFFNPMNADQYHKIIPVYIDDKDQPKDRPYIELVLQGVAVRPKLQFDRREVILPVVPLGIESRCSFRVLNDGYENLNLKTRVYGEEGSINLKLDFPEGTNLGITKKRLRVDAVFLSHRPISFTTRVEFYDEMGRNYPIPVSGTADNSILTSYSYLQRCSGEFRYGLEDEQNNRGAVMLIDNDQDVSSEAGSTQQRGIQVKKGAPSVMSSKTFSSNISGRSTKSALGYTPIPQDLVVKNKEYAGKWLNQFLQTQTLHSFPDNVIEADGQQIFDLISFLSGKNSPLPFEITEKNGKKSERINNLLKQYDELIRMLKSEGALLNHIRPYHLLNFNDFNYVLKMLPKEEIDLIHPNVLKVPPQRYNYVSADAWCVLFYQILKIYALARVNIKNFKNIPGVPANTIMPEFNSNVYSREECTLLRWLEVHLEGQFGQQQRILSFDKDLRDGWALAATIQAYVGGQSNQYFQGMKQKCLMEDEFIYNSQRIFKALQDINLLSPFEQRDFSHPSHKDMVLLVLLLFNNLPNYIPRGTPVIFQCVLGHECIRTLDLHNPTNKPICYWVRYEGVPDFILEGDDNFRIEPKGNYKFKIRFVSRVGQSVQGRITFTNKRESNTAATTLVYDLKSQIIGRVSEQTHQINCPLYENKDFSIQIQNKFMASEFGTFQVQIIHEKVLKEIVPNKDKQQNTKKKKIINSKSDIQEIFPCIFCRTEMIRLKRGQPYSLQLQFIPLMMDSYRVLVVFSDPQVGEFQHEIITQVDLPEQMIEYKPPTFYVDQIQTLEYNISVKNEAQHKARKMIEHIYQEKKIKKIFQFPGGTPEQTIFDVELTGGFNFIQVPKQFTLIDKHQQQKMPKIQQQQFDTISQGTLGTNRISKIDQSKLDQSNLLSNIGSEIGFNKIPITYVFKQPVKELICILNMKNIDKTDVRRYKLIVTALPKPIKADIEMCCPAREQIVQDIPISNPSDKDWIIKVQLISDNIQGLPAFSIQNISGGSLLLQQNEETTMASTQQHQTKQNNTNILKGGLWKDFQVKKKSTVQVQLLFTPKWICQVEGHITMINQLTNDIFDYNLKGIGEEPLAECHIAMKCQARRTTKKEIYFNNTTQKTIEYRVETDLLNASGLTQFKIPPLQKYTYLLTVTPTLSGQYTGSITFFDDLGEYIWYTVLLDTESPRAEKDLELITQARKPIAFDIELTNPFIDEQITYEVSITGKDLMGEKYFTVLPGMTSTYEIIYMPLLPGRDIGQVGFINTKLGEIWYTLTLISEDRQVTRLPMIRTELGKVETIEVLLENPTPNEVVANTALSNPANFEVLPDTILLQPFTQTPAYIRYIPSALDTPQTSEILFTTKELGKWEFMVFGMGIAPTAYPQRIITVGLNKDHSEMINFKNPFKDTIQVSITLESEDSESLEVFSLLLKNKKNDGRTQIIGLQQIQLPFSFTPREIRSYRCEIVITMNDKIKWRYPIIGHTESFAVGPIATLKTKSRIPLIQEVKFQLPGMGFSNVNSKFNFEFKSNTKEISQLLDRCFKIKLLKDQLKEGEDTLVFEIRFNPMKPFKTLIDIIIQRDIGGVWKYYFIIQNQKLRFPLQLEANPPEPDDLIVITSPLQRTSSVSFKLTNRYKQFANFTAIFTASSDQEFNVSPRQGLLEPFGRDGTTFIVSFTPLEYGQIKQGKLIIETDEMFWSYNVRGTLPKYIPPVVKESKIVDRLSPQYEQMIATRKPKNFIQTNISKQRSPGRSNSPNKDTQQQSQMNVTRFTKTIASQQNLDTKSMQNLKSKKTLK